MGVNFVFVSEDEMGQYEDQTNCFGTHFDEKLIDCKSCTDHERCAALFNGAIPKLYNEATVEEVYDDQPSRMAYDKESFLSLHDELTKEYLLDIEKTKLKTKVFFPASRESKDAKDFVHVLDVTAKGIQFHDADVFGSINLGPTKSLSDTKGFPTIEFNEETYELIRPIVEEYYKRLANKYTPEPVDLDITVGSMLRDFVAMYNENRDKESKFLEAIQSMI